MPIKQLTPMSEINAYTETALDRLEAAILRIFMEIGERVLNVARSTKSYRDRTKNLRSSLGYVISVDGKIAKSSNFEKGIQGSEGASEGEAYIKTLVRNFPKGIVLIVVAGMNYAAYVSAKGYDVLDSSELLADRLVPQMLKQLGLQ